MSRQDEGGTVRTTRISVNILNGYFVRNFTEIVPNFKGNNTKGAGCWVYVFIKGKREKIGK